MYELALALGRSVRELEQWPASEVLGWQAFYRIQPFGPWRDNLHSAQIAHILAAVNTPSGKPKPRLQDYMYQDPETRRRNEERQALAWFDIRAKENG